MGKCSRGFKRTTAPSHRRSQISLCFHFDLSFFPPPSLYCYCLPIDSLSSSFSVSPDVLPFTLVSYLPPSNSFVLKHSFTTFPHLRSLRPPSEPALALCPYTHLCLPFECFQRPIKQRLGRARHTHLTPKTHRMKEGYQIPLSMPDTHTHSQKLKFGGTMHIEALCFLLLTLGHEIKLDFPSSHWDCEVGLKPARLVTGRTQYPQAEKVGLDLGVGVHLLNLGMLQLCLLLANGRNSSVQDGGSCKCNVTHAIEC